MNASIDTIKEDDLVKEDEDTMRDRKKIEAEGTNTKEKESSPQIMMLKEEEYAEEG